MIGLSHMITKAKMSDYLSSVSWGSRKASGVIQSESKGRITRGPQVSVPDSGGPKLGASKSKDITVQ